jgi:phosphoglycerate dehydrogenase-like enzyme
MLRTLLLYLTLTIAGTALAQDDWTVDDFIAETGVREGAVPARELPGWRPDPTIMLWADPDDVASIAREFPDTRFIVAGAEEADVIVGSCDADAIRAAENLVWVQIFSAGAERCLAVEELRSGKVLLTNMQKMSSPAIGEHAVAMALSLARGLIRYGKVMPDGAWRRDMTQEPDMFSVSGKTMLVVGLGGIGTAAAKRAKALGMRVIATRNSSREGPSFVDYVGLSDELPELAGKADIIVNALPLTSSTAGMFDKALFAQAKPGAYFINVGRGGTVVTDALVEALESGRLAGAGLDVTDPEPLPSDHPLWQMPNVIITPHVSWAGADRRLHNMLLRENIRRYLAGERLLNVVDPERGY